MVLMMSSRFTIVKVKRPDRCDVCHRSDMFDPETGICERCKQLPIEELANPEINSIQTIPPSIGASTIAAAITCFCLSATLAILNGTFGPASQMMSRVHGFLCGLLALCAINLFTSIVINRWCSDRYNERLDYRVAAMGTFSSGIGLIASLIGMVFSFTRLLIN